MVIDFHTHAFPDKIAERSIAALVNAAPGVEAHTDGTLEGLRQSMMNAGVDISVILPVATRKGQLETINREAARINAEYRELVSFGAIHPDDDEPEARLEALHKQGFKGITLHPDYTGTFIDDPRYIRIITAAARLGLLVVTHSGVDPAFDVIHCPPERGRAVLDRVMKETGRQEPFMIFAHLGGMMMHKEVEKHLAGAPCYIDISCSFPSLMEFCNNTDEDVVRIIRKHGADRILFATDSPWNCQSAYVRHFRELDGLTAAEKEMILHSNAERLLSAFPLKSTYTL